MENGGKVDRKKGRQGCLPLVVRGRAGRDLRALCYHIQYLYNSGVLNKKMTAVLYELMLKLEKLRSHPPPMSLVEDVEICVLYTEQENYTVSK